MPRKPKEKVRSARLLLWGALGLSALLIGGALFGRGGYLAVLVNQQRIETLEAGIVSLRQGNRRLRQEVYSLKNDLASIERIAREELGLVKPGETVYELLPPAKDR